MKETEKYLDKIKGSLYGGAVGDSLGYPIEFFHEDEILERYGNSGIQEFKLDPKTGKALISDDTQMSLFTANGVLFAQTRGKLRGIGGAPRYYMEHFYLNWLITQEYAFTEKDKAEGLKLSWLLDVPELYSRKAPGNTCLSSLERIKRERFKPEDGDYISDPQNDSKGCGGIMRVAPMGLVSYTNISMDTIDKEGAQLSAITHGHPLGYMSAAVLVHIVHQLVYSDDNRSLKDIVWKQGTKYLIYLLIISLLKNSQILSTFQ